jgi:ferredoxin
LAPSLFQVGDDGIAVVLREVDDVGAAIDAADSCPMGAITVIEDEDRAAA